MIPTYLFILKLLLELTTDARRQRNDGVYFCDTFHLWVVVSQVIQFVQL